MSTNNTNALPLDRKGNVLQEFPAPFVAKKRYTSENASASSVISLTHDTTSLEVAAIGQSAALKWITLADTTASVITIAGSTSNYDHVIPVGTVRRFALPQETQGIGQGSIVGINRGAGLYQRVAIQSFGIGSVLAIEF